MPKIDITVDEIIAVTSALQLRAMELDDVGCHEMAQKYESLRKDLHNRFAHARVLEETNDPD